jgi:hypothetical protein
MEPHGRLNKNIRSLFGIPWQVGLRLARNQTPVDRRYVILIGNMERTVKGTSGSAAMYSMQRMGLPALAVKSCSVGVEARVSLFWSGAPRRSLVSAALQRL